MHLLDASVLIPLVWPDHAHGPAAERWFGQLDSGFATCPITQGSLVRFLLRTAVDPLVATAGLRELVADRRHTFVADDVSFHQVEMTTLTGHRQVTDAYLAALARSHGARLATFDRGLALLHPDVADLVPV